MFLTTVNTACKCVILNSSCGCCFALILASKLKFSLKLEHTLENICVVGSNPYNLVRSSLEGVGGAIGPLGNLPPSGWSLFTLFLPGRKWWDIAGDIIGRNVLYVVWATGILFSSQCCWGGGNIWQRRAASSRWLRRPRARAIPRKAGIVNLQSFTGIRKLVKQNREDKQKKRNFWELVA